MLASGGCSSARVRGGYTGENEPALAGVLYQGSTQSHPLTEDMADA